MAADHAAAARAVYGETVDTYVDRIGTEISAAVEGDLDRRLLTDFVDRAAAMPGVVVDLGCGPGRVARFVHDRSGADGRVEVCGFDVSPEMVAAARTAHPGLAFEVGQLDDIPLDDSVASTVICWYSIIHTPLHELPAAWSEIRRVLTPAGRLLVAFQAGDNQPVRQERAHGTDHALDLQRHRPADVAASLSAAEFEVVAVVERPAEHDHESTPQAFIEAVRR